MFKVKVKRKKDQELDVSLECPVNSKGKRYKKSKLEATPENYVLSKSGESDDEPSPTPPDE